jgi:3'-phosphoadenosine 5'-phosphosulfate (PAPS) 3'-phosphatase
MRRRWSEVLPGRERPRSCVRTKRATYKIWDVAPGQVILREAGADVRRWDGTEIRYDRLDIRVPNVVAAHRGLVKLAIRELKHSVVLTTP